MLVNALNKYRPLFAPEMETGHEEAPAPAPLNETLVDGPGSARGTLRQQLEENFSNARKEPGDQSEPELKAKPKKVQVSRARQEQQEAEPEKQGQQGEQQQEAALEGQEQQQEAAPQGWPEEAKTEWANTPPAVRQAVAKREQDVAKGVAALKKRYTDIDAALAPRMALINQHNQTPAAAVNQLFSWFEALNGDRERLQQGQPPAALIALANSFGMTPQILAQVFAGAQQQQGQEQQDPNKEQQALDGVPDPVKQYIGRLEQYIQQMGQHFNNQIGSLGQSFQHQTFSKTQEILDAWSKDKPFLNEEGVRQYMARLISPGPVGPDGQPTPPIVAPLANGAADLDTAYDMAINALPGVRGKVTQATEAKRLAAEKATREKELKAQQEHANNARRASGSLGIQAPGNPVSTQQKGRGKGRSVRESIADAMQELGA